MEKEFLKYLRNSLNTIYDYFLSDEWISYQTNIKILSDFISSCAYSYPDVQGKLIFDNPTMEDTTPKSLWLYNSRKLTEISHEIIGRKRPGPNDLALRDRAKSKIRALRSTIPDRWVGQSPSVPEEIVNIIDKGSRYFYKEIFK